MQKTNYSFSASSWLFYDFKIFFSEPPSPPEINGLPQNETLREGQSVNLVNIFLIQKKLGRLVIDI